MIKRAIIESSHRYLYRRHKDMGRYYIYDRKLGEFQDLGVSSSNVLSLLNKLSKDRFIKRWNNNELVYFIYDLKEEKFVCKIRDTWEIQKLLNGGY